MSMNRLIRSFLRPVPVAVLVTSVGLVALVAAQEKTAPQPVGNRVPDSKHLGGEPESIVQVANLVYAGVKSSHCFSDHFLIAAEKTSTISTSRRFHAVKLSSAELFDHPLVIMTGEGDFSLTDEERQNLRSYVERGGFLLASASCSSQEWNRAFRTEMSRLFKDHPLRVIPMDHPMFNTVTKITALKAR